MKNGEKDTFSLSLLVSLSPFSLCLPPPSSNTSPSSSLLQHLLLLLLPTLSLSLSLGVSLSGCSIPHIPSAGNNRPSSLLPPPPPSPLSPPSWLFLRSAAPLLLQSAGGEPRCATVRRRCSVTHTLFVVIVFLSFCSFFL